MVKEIVPPRDRAEHAPHPLVGLVDRGGSGPRSASADRFRRGVRFVLTGNTHNLDSRSENRVDREASFNPFGCEPGLDPFGLFRLKRGFDGGHVVADRAFVGAFVVSSVEDGLEVQCERRDRLKAGERRSPAISTRA